MKKTLKRMLSALLLFSLLAFLASCGRINQGGAFLGEYSTNFDLTSTAALSAVSFFATSNAGFKLYLNNLVAVSAAKETALAAKLDSVTRYVRSNLSRRLPLEDVASFVGYSPSYFHKIFKKATGVTLADYIRNERIKRAVHLMATTSHTLTQIAYECGFSGQSYFSAAFRQMMGVTPRHYVERRGR